MSVLSDALEAAANAKFGSGYSYNEWYSPNQDSVNYTVTYNETSATVSLSGLTMLMNQDTPLEILMRTQLDELFQ